MPVIRYDSTDDTRQKAVPRLESVIPFLFSVSDRSTDPADMWAFRDHATSLTGESDLGWYERSPAVTYHDMAEVVSRSLGPDALAGVDLIVTVAGTPDCRHDSLPAVVLAARVNDDALVVGVTEQGAAGAYTALRIARSHLAAGSRRRALVVIMENSTLPPGYRRADRPRQDSAVALLLGTQPGPGPLLGPIRISVTGRGEPPAPPDWLTSAGTPRPGARTLIAGKGLREIAPAPGIDMVPATAGHPVTGAWLALADHLEGAAQRSRDILVADHDRDLPYLCSLTLTWPAAPPRTPEQDNRRVLTEVAP